MRSLVLSDAVEKWTVEFDVRDSGGHIDSSFRGSATTLSARVGIAAKDVKAVMVIPGGFCMVRTKFMSSALHVCEASRVAQGCFLKFCAACDFCGLVPAHAIGT